MRGPDARKLLSEVTVNSFAKFDVGQSKQAIHTNADGKLIHEAVLRRLGKADVMLFENAAGSGLTTSCGSADMTSSPRSTTGSTFQVSGPNSVFVVEKAAGQNVRDIKFMHSGRLEIAGHEVPALRQGMSGEIGFELQGPSANAEAVYNAVLTAGEELGIRRLGARATQINHLEACFPTIVSDYLPAIFAPISTSISPRFRAAMPAFASTFHIAGSFDADDVSAWYRSPVELGCERNVKFDHAETSVRRRRTNADTESSRIDARLVP